MHTQLSKTQLFRTMAVAATSALAASQLTGCPGFDFPPVPVETEMILGVEIPALAAASGSADVDLDELCVLFSAGDAEELVRDAAGGDIDSFTEITRIELVATDIAATEGTFEPFNTASLEVARTSGGDPLILGAAESNDGFDTEFSLVLDNPVDVLNDLDESECDGVTLHLDGAGILEGEDITFDVSVRLLVYTQVPEN